MLDILKQFFEDIVMFFIHDISLCITHAVEKT